MIMNDIIVFLLLLKDLGFDSGNYNTFCSCPKHPDRPCGPSSPLPVGTVLPFPRLQRQKRETDKSLRSSADIVNMGSNNSTPSYAFTVCRNRKCTLLLFYL